MDNVIAISVFPHYSLNTKKGVIRCSDIKDCTDEEILEPLKDEGVIKLDRITVFRDAFRKQTGTFIFTFQSQTLPKYIMVGYYRMAVSHLFLIQSDAINVRNLATLNSTAEKNEVCNKSGQEDHLLLGMQK